jgi:hypothetical protein
MHPRLKAIDLVFFYSAIDDSGEFNDDAMMTVGCIVSI